MNPEEIRSYCLSLPGVTEDIKWENNLVFSIGGKMFCVTCMDCEPQTISFKVEDETFEALIHQMHFIPAPYLARAKWVQLEDGKSISSGELMKFIKQSYLLIRSKLTKKIQQELPPVG